MTLVLDSTRFMPRIELEYIEEVDDAAETSTESFDRIAFAQRALALVHPSGTTVAICAGSRRVRVDAGRQWGKPVGERWAVLSVPVNASRKAIARGILELAAYGALRPWALDILVGGCETAYRGPARPSGEPEDG